MFVSVGRSGRWTVVRSTVGQRKLSKKLVEKTQKPTGCRPNGLVPPTLAAANQSVVEQAGK